MQHDYFQKKKLFWSFEPTPEVKGVSTGKRGPKLSQNFAGDLQIRTDLYLLMLYPSVNFEWN